MHFRPLPHRNFDTIYFLPLAVPRVKAIIDIVLTNTNTEQSICDKFIAQTVKLIGKVLPFMPGSFYSPDITFNARIGTDATVKLEHCFTVKDSAKCEPLNKVLRNLNEKKCVNEVKQCQEGTYILFHMPPAGIRHRAPAAIGRPMSIFANTESKIDNLFMGNNSNQPYVFSSDDGYAHSKSSDGEIPFNQAIAQASQTYFNTLPPDERVYTINHDACRRSLFDFITTMSDFYMKTVQTQMLGNFLLTAIGAPLIGMGGKRIKAKSKRQKRKYRKYYFQDGAARAGTK
jgi:hypothetical protein